MATYEKVKLSGAGTTNAAINTTYGSDMLIHATGTSSTILDEVWLWVSNTDADYSAEITVGPVRALIPPRTTILVIPGHPISGTGSAATQIRFNDISLSATTLTFGYVNRITP
jgi:hypothetical protein